MWIVLLMVILFLIWIVLSIKTDTEKNSYNIEWAVDMLEVAVKITNQFAKESDSICIDFVKSETQTGYIIRLKGFSMTDFTSLKNVLCQTSIQWEIYQEENKTVFVQYESASGYVGAWKPFQKAVWNEAKKRHPEWDIHDNFLNV